MFTLIFYILCAVALTRAIDEGSQLPLMSVGTQAFRGVPGGSIVRMCPESRDTDIMDIERIVNVPQVLYLNEEIDVFIWGNLIRGVSNSSTVDYQINATANTGDFGSLNGTFHICDNLEKMYQPPNSTEPEKACPPDKGFVFINYAYWFADFLVAPGQWSIKIDAKTPEGDRIYCLETEFDLQCPPERSDSTCLRDVSDTLQISWMQQKEPSEGSKE